MIHYIIITDIEEFCKCFGNGILPQWGYYVEIYTFKRLFGLQIHDFLHTR